MKLSSARPARKPYPQPRRKIPSADKVQGAVSLKVTGKVERRNIHKERHPGEGLQ
jgi:hypothetical protein